MEGLRTGGNGFGKKFGKKSKLIENAKKGGTTLESGKVYFGKTEDGKSIEIYEDEANIQDDTNPPTGYPDLREPLYAKINPGIEKEKIGYSPYKKSNENLVKDIIEESNKVEWPKPAKERIKDIENKINFIDSKPEPEPDSKPSVWPEPKPNTTNTPVEYIKEPRPDVWKTTPLYGGGGGRSPEKYEVEREGGEHIDFGEVTVYETAKRLDKVISKIDDLNRKVDYLIENSN